MRELILAGLVALLISGLETQSMMKAKKLKGRLEQANLGMFRFVPLKGAHGHKVL